MTKIENALIFATKAHAGKYRKGTDRPYIIHPIEVMSIVMHFTDDKSLNYDVGVVWNLQEGSYLVVNQNPVTFTQTPASPFEFVTK